MNGLPANAVRVRADEVQPGDELVVDGESCGKVSGCDMALVGVVRVCTERHGPLFRRVGELVWVVRPERTVTLTIELPEKAVRAFAAEGPAPLHLVTVCRGRDLRPDAAAFESACREWVSAHREGETA